MRDNRKRDRDRVKNEIKNPNFCKLFEKKISKQVHDKTKIIMIELIQIKSNQRDLGLGESDCIDCLLHRNLLDHFFPHLKLPFDMFSVSLRIIVEL